MMKIRERFPAALAVALMAAGCSAPAPDEATVPASETGQTATPALTETPDSQPPKSPQAPVNEDPGLYSELEGGACKVVSVDREAGGSTTRCPGVEGFELIVQDHDARMSVEVVEPGGNVTPLQLTSVVGQGAFSSLGPRAEWRLDAQGKPSALIVRFNVFADPEQPERPTSYLVVARIAGGNTCAVAAVSPSPDQNMEARRVADDAAEKACLPVPGA